MTKRQRNSALPGRLWRLPLCAAAVLLCSGCAVRRAAMPAVHTRADTVYRVQAERDTLRLHDSVYVSIVSKNDTVYRTKETWRWRDRMQVRTDTVYRTRLQHDTVYVAQPARSRVYATVRNGMTWAARVLAVVPLLAVVAAAFRLVRK